MTDLALPQKIMSALRRLRGHYEKNNETDLRDLIEGSKVHVDPSTEFDNWNGGQHGHDVLFFVPDEMMALIDLDEQDQIFSRIRDDINKATPNIENEYIRAVHIGPQDDTDMHCQAAIRFSRAPRENPNSVGLWRENCLRLFISHRDQYKAEAHVLADALEPFGVSSFVAHDTIQPMKDWQPEIEKGLMTMEVMLVMLTDDFHDSNWTNQEVGFALGKGIPIITVKVGKIDPQGFIGTKQAMKAIINAMDKAAPEIQRLLINEIGQEERLKSIMIEAFLTSPNFHESMERFKRLKETADQLTEKEFDQIVEGYSKNDQLYNCGGIHTSGYWFQRYLERATGKKVIINGPRIREDKSTLDEIFS